jgi:hypothetical protein
VAEIDAAWIVLLLSLTGVGLVFTLVVRLIKSATGGLR